MVHSFGVIWIRISDPRWWCIKGTNKSSLVTDSLVPLMYHDQSDLWSLILIQITPKECNLNLKPFYTIFLGIYSWVIQKIHLNALTPVLPITHVPSLSSTSDVITFHQNGHHLNSTSAGGKDLSSDAQIRMIGLMEPEISTKMLKKISEKLRAKFPATTPGCSMVKIACLDDAFLEVF